MHWRVALGDVSVAIETSDEDRASAVQRLFPRAEACPLAVPSDIPVAFRARPLPRPCRVPDVVGDDVNLWSDGETVVGEHASGIRGWADCTRAEIGGEQQRVDLEFAFHRLFPILATHLLGWRSRFVLHAGALVRNGSARVLLGGSGTGKSTLALAAGRDGWTLLSDDLSVLREQDGQILVAGVAARTAVPADVDPLLGRVGRPLPGDERGRVEIDVEPAAGWHTVHGTVLTGHGTTSSGDLRVVEQPKVWAMLLASFLASGSAPLLRRYFPLAGRLSRMPAWRLYHSCDAAARLQVAQGLLAQVTETAVPA